MRGKARPIRREVKETAGRDSFNRMRPRVFLLGAGPGDPELITLRALRRLRDADVVLYDALIHPNLLDHTRPDAERIFVGKRAGRIYERQESIHERIRDAVNAGKSVARLKGGDPYLFGRGSEEAEFLAREGIPFEVVPGVPSPVAAAVYAGLSLTHREASSSVAFVTATESAQKDRDSHDWSKLATATQTIVFFMGLRKIEALMTLLMTHGRDPNTPAAIVEKASLPAQRTLVATIGTIAARAQEEKIGTPALIIVGEIARFRDSLRWFDTKPLFGKRVLVLRPEGQTEEISRMLRDEGAEPLVQPILRIMPPTDPSLLEAALRRLETYAHIVFTSTNGVDAFFTTLQAQKRDARAIGGAKVVAVGPATEARLRAHGIISDFMPKEFRGEAAGTEVLLALGENARGARVLLPRAEVAREVLPEMLRAAGVLVDDVPVYRTEGPSDAAQAAIRALAEAHMFDIVMLTSPSSAEHFARLTEGISRTWITASIGPITTSRAIELGLHVDLTATNSTASVLVDALSELRR